MNAQKCPYQALDSSAMPISGIASVGGMDGWPDKPTHIGWSNSLGWSEGFSLLAAVDPSGVVTGFCFAAASTADQQLAETFFAVRAQPNERLISVGSASSRPYIADKGFEGAENHRRWLENYGAHIIHPPKCNSRKKRWSKRLRRWVASIRQIIERASRTSCSLFNTFGLWRERGPMTLRVCGRVWRRG